MDNLLRILSVALRFFRRYSKRAYSQGGAKFPTGGKSALLKARERFRPAGLKVSRSGVIPGPTVTVRMGESNDSSRLFVRLAVIFCLHDTPKLALILVTHTFNKVYLP